MKHLIILILICAGVITNAQTKLYAVRFNTNGTTDSFYVNLTGVGVYNSSGNYVMPRLDSMQAINGYVYPQSVGLFFQRADGVFSNLVFPGSTAIPQSQVTDLTTDLAGKLATNGNGSSLTGLTKSQVGLANVDNTSDANKPVSSATQTALNLKANLASPTFTGTVGGITATMVGLGNVNNTSDANKPISTATQTALDGKQATLISGTNIKTVNNTSLLGSGNIAIAGGEAFPIGSVFISVVATNPNTLLGYGTWEAFAPGRMLVGFDNTNPNFDVAEETGGSATVTITADNLPQLSVSITDPGHTHVQNKNTATTGPLSGTTPDASTNNSAASDYSTASATTGITATANTGGANNSITVLNPYITVYMWKRTN